MNQAMPCPYCGKIGYHAWAGDIGCPGADIQELREYRQQGVGDLLRLIDLQKALLARAADALEAGHEGRTGLPYAQKPGCRLCDLITELRKAAR